MWETLSPAEQKQVAELLARWVMTLAHQRLKATDDWDEYHSYVGSNGALWYAADTIRRQNSDRATLKGSKK